MTENPLVETYSALNAVPGIRHAFVRRIPGLDVAVDREAALSRLASHHEDLRRTLGAGSYALARAEQVHGAEVAVVRSVDDAMSPGADGLVTDCAGLCLAIYVADCCAVYLVDPVRGAFGLVHSGRKGSELGIVAHAISTMQREFQSRPEDLIVQLSPCIRPPHYEVDFASEIVDQCRAAGVSQIYDSGVCTACHPDRYYSYRLEKGRTGRLVAWMWKDSHSP